MYLEKMSTTKMRFKPFYYASPPRPEGPRRCPDSIFELVMVIWNGYMDWVCIPSRKIGVSKLGSSNSTVGRGHLRSYFFCTLFSYSFMVLFGTFWYFLIFVGVAL